MRRTGWSDAGYAARPQAASKRPCSACDRRGSAARLRPFQASVKLFKSRQTVRPWSANSANFGVSPLVEHGRQLGHRQHLGIDRPNHEVVDRAVIHFRLLVVGDPLVLLAPQVGKTADRRMDHPRQVPLDEAGVSTSNGDLARKRQIIANEDGMTERDRRGKRLVVRIAEPDHQAVVIVGLAVGDLQETEVPLALLPERVGLADDPHAVCHERRFDLFQQPMVGDGYPGRGAGRRGGPLDGLALDVSGTAVEYEIEHGLRLSFQCRLGFRERESRSRPIRATRAADPRSSRPTDAVARLEWADWSAAG